MCIRDRADFALEGIPERRRAAGGVAIERGGVLWLLVAGSGSLSERPTAVSCGPVDPAQNRPEGAPKLEGQLTAATASGSSRPSAAVHERPLKVIEQSARHPVARAHPSTTTGADGQHAAPADQIPQTRQLAAQRRRWAEFRTVVQASDLSTYQFCPWL